MYRARAYARKVVPQFWVWLAIAFTGVYLLWFFSQPILEDIRRMDLFIRLLLPGELMNWTIGNGADHLRVGIADRFLPISLTSLWLLTAWWLGRPALYAIAHKLTWLESTGLSCLFGLSLLSTSVLLLGLCGNMNRPVLVCTVVVLCLTSLMVQRQVGLSSGNSRNQLVPNACVAASQVSRWLWRLVPLAVCLLLAMYVASGLMPPLEFDVVEYHAQAPKEFFQQGGISFLEHNVYANMPLGIEMHTLAAMVLIGGQDGWWYGGITGNCIICMFSLLSAAVTGGYAARNFGRDVGWATAAILLSAPGNILTAGYGLVDSAMGAYILATVVCLQAWRERQTSQSKELISIPISLILTGFFAGAAATCKYTGLIFAGIPTLLYLLAESYRNLRSWPILKLNLMVALLCIANVAPWYAKNAFWTANPVYPLASNLFGSGNLSEEQSQRWNRVHQVPKSPNGSAYDWNSLRTSLLTLAGKSEYLPAVMVPWVLIGIGVSSSGLWRHPITLPLMLGCWIVLVWWSATHRIDRFWLPSLPLFSLVAAAGMHWLMTRYQSTVVAFGILISLTYGGIVSISGIFTDSRWFVSYDSLREDVGTAESAGRLPKTIGWLNKSLPAESKILAIGEARAFFFERPLLYATCFNTPPGESALRQAVPREQFEWLSRNGVTHLFVQWREIERYRGAGNYGFSKWPQPSDIKSMIDSGVVRKVDDWPFDPQSADLLQVNPNFIDLKENSP